MDKRFTIKDFVLFTIISLVIVMVAVAMFQIDRQWRVMAQISRQAGEQTQQLSQISRMLASGVRASGPTTGPSVAISGSDPFGRVRAAQKMPGYTAGDWVIDSGANLEKITPLTSTDYDSSVLQSRVLEGLATRDPVTLEWIPLLAESWKTILPPATQPSSQPSASSQPIAGATFIFKMRPNVTFSDGQPVTADDVVFTFDLIMNPKIEAPRQRAYYSKMASVTKTGPDEVTFKFKEPYFESFDLAGGLQVMPKHFYSRFTPAEFNSRTGLLMGSGPYKLEDTENWSPGKPLQFVRNDRYWGEPGPFDRIVFREISNELARMTSFRNGDIDFYDKIQPEQFSEMLKDKTLVDRTQQHAFETPTRGYRYIAWNEFRNGKPTRFADKRVRQALTMLTDRQKICDDIMMGYAKVAVSPFFYKMKQHDASIQPWPFDPTRAKALLKDAGFTDRDGDGVLDGPDGSPFRFKLTYPSGVSNYQRIALFLKDTYASAGIVLEPDPLDWSVFSDRMKNRDYDAISLMWSGGIESDIYQMFHSSQIEDQGDNHMSYRNAELDKLIEQARTTVDETARMPLWHKAEQIIHEDQPYTFMFNVKQMVFLDKRFQNVQPLALDINDITEWYVPTAMQKWSK